MKGRVAGATGVGHFVPGRVVTSAEVEERVTASSDGFKMPRGLIQLLTGVAKRRYAEPGVASSDLAAEAGRRAMADAVVDPLSVDLVIFASASHDVAEPATANILQMKTGCTNSAVFDVKNACNSFVNGLDVAQAFIETGRAHRVLVAAGEVLSPTINWSVRDKADLARKLAAFTLGDGGAACVVEAVDAGEGRGLLPGLFVSEGEHWELSTILGGGTLHGFDPALQFFECDSAQLQGLAVGQLPGLVTKAVESVGWNLDDVDRIVPHQVSRSVIEQISSLLGIPVEKTEMTLNQFGNTAAASIPIALSLAVEEQRIRRGDKVLLVGGAAGFSAGVIPLIW
jgi:3-oxoacyl-[acyl-carrier-protein] synthase-3